MTIQETIRQAYPGYSFIENLGFINLFLIIAVLTGATIFTSLKLQKLKFVGNKDVDDQNKAIDTVSKITVGAVFTYIAIAVVFSQAEIGINGKFWGEEYTSLETGFDSLAKILASDFKIEAKRYSSNKDYYLLKKPSAVLTETRLGQVVTLDRPAIRMLLTDGELRALELQAANNPTLLSRLQLKVENSIVNR